MSSKKQHGGAGRGQGRHPAEIKGKRKRYAYCEVEIPATPDEIAAWNWWRTKKPLERLGLIVKIFLIDANLKL